MLFSFVFSYHEFCSILYYSLLNDFFQLRHFQARDPAVIANRLIQTAILLTTTACQIYSSDTRVSRQGSLEVTGST
jgi:hypothetical protein